MVWKTLLVPLDGSSTAEAALPYAEAIARATDAPIRLVSVIVIEPDGLPGRPAHLRALLERATRSGTEQYLTLTATMLREWGRQVSTVMAEGRPADEILAAADVDDAAMIVMATHGRGGFERLFVGSVADKVMRLSTRPVLLVRPPEAAAPLRTVSLQRLMVPLDGSPLAEQALAMAGELAQAAGASLTLIRAVPWLAAMITPYADGGVPVANLDEMEREVGAAAESYLQDVRGRLPAQIPVETVVLRGMPGAMLIDFAQNRAFDLIVMSTHGRGGLRRLVLGSTADRMVRSGLPTLLVRPVASEGGHEPGQGPAPGIV